MDCLLIQNRMRISRNSGVKPAIPRLLALCLIVGASWADSSHAYLGTSFLWKLSDFTGTVPYHWVSIFTDASQGEAYVVNRSDGSVRVFNATGMEIYGFGEETALGAVQDGAIHPEGDIFVLTYKKGRNSVTRCNFRGEPSTTIEIKNFPPEFEGIRPVRIAYRKGRLYLADLSAMKVVSLTEEGVFEQGFDLAARLGLTEQERAESGLGGFGVDDDGNILFTVPVLFVAYKLAPDGQLTGFGEPGQTQGKFGVVAGIVSDGRGNILIADTLRCAVLIFDKNLRFQSEFGYRGSLPRNLIAPRDLAVEQDRLYVAQGGNRGVSVFRMSYE